MVAMTSNANYQLETLLIKKYSLCVHYSNLSLLNAVIEIQYHDNNQTYIIQIFKNNISQLSQVVNQDYSDLLQSVHAVAVLLSLLL